MVNIGYAILSLLFALLSAAEIFFIVYKKEWEERRFYKALGIAGAVFFGLEAIIMAMYAN